ncbi:MAG: polysaccharide biosynthesis tyrosine autokinase [Pyrinomonadaceae bacterium]
MSEDNRLLPLSSESLDRPLRDLTQPVVPAAAPSSEPAHLREYLAVVLKRKWLILSLMVVITSLVAIQMYRMPSTYEASTTIQIEQKSKSVLSTGRGGDLVIRGGNDANYWNTQLKLLETEQLARQVIMRLDLQNNPAFLGGQRGTGLITSLRRVVSREQPTPTPQDGGVPLVAADADLTAETLSPEQLQRLEPYEDTLRDGLIIEPVEKTNLVTIRYVHTDPEVARNVTNTLANVFIENDIRRETTGSDKAEDVLARQIIDLQAQIQQGEAKRLNYRRSNDLPLGDKQGQDFNAVRLQTYSSQLQQTEADRKTAEAAYQSALRSSNDMMSVPEVQDSAAVRRMREKIETLETQKAALLVNYTEDWPEVKKIDKQVEQLEAEMKKTPREIVTGLKNRYEALVKKEAGLRSSYDAERSKANSMSVAETGLADISQSLETNRQLLNTYQQRQKELQVTQSDRGQNVTQVEEARLPRTPIGPPRVRNILIALLLSLGAGIGLSFLLDYLDDTLKSIEDVDRHLHLPTLALIPAPRAERSLLSRNRGMPLQDPSDNTALALIDDARSPVAEAYRHLRTSLLLSSAGQPPRTVLVTSSQPSEGKTTTAVNIAMMLAQTGADVLLLDCDLRRPRIHGHFGLPNTRGVTNYLSGEANVSELVQTCERLPNLKVITSGPIPPNAAELLGSDEMRKLLYVLSENFAHIIIDSPPAISFTDASILSTMVDGVMLVVHGGRSSRAVVRRAKQQLQDVGAHIFGIVLNNVKLESNDYYYYSGYYSSYYAEEEHAPEEAETAGAGDRR